MEEEPETIKSNDDDRKQIDISMFPTPFLYGEDECPAEFSHEYGKIDSEASHWHINSNYPTEHDGNAILDQDTTIYDVRSPTLSPTMPGKHSVKFAPNVENIEGI